MTTVREAVLAGEYGRGLEQYDRLTEPKAEDLRWAGVCAAQQGQVVQAQQQLEQAAQRGCPAARIDLASLHRAAGEFAQALTSLALVQEALPLLPLLDQALWYRERAIVGHELGEGMPTVLGFFEQAWVTASDAPLAMQASVAHAYGMHLTRFGEDHRASAYLEFAAEHGHSVRRTYALATLAACAVYQGGGSQARALLDTVRKASAHDPMLEAVLAYHEGQLFRIEGADEQALSAFQRAVSLARTEMRPSTELHAQLGLLALATEREDEAMARTALVRARRLVRAPRDEAFLKWREGSWWASQGDRGGLGLLEEAVSFFQDRELRREALWSQLHLAEAQERFGQGEACAASLSEAADLVAAFETPPTLVAELRLTPRVTARLESLPPRAYERLHLLKEDVQNLRQVNLKTLGGAEVLINGQSIRLRLKRVVEVLAYLLKSGGASLAEVQRDLFPDVRPAQAKGYFHQIRLHIKERIPGLSVPFDEVRGTYAVRSEGARLTWDVQLLTAELARPQDSLLKILERYELDFLKDADSVWATEERERLRRWVTQVALETMDGWYRTGQFEKCVSLAERLLPLDPLDEALHEFLIQATLETRGRAAAYQSYLTSAETFRREVDEVPTRLKALGEDIRKCPLN
ncbi:BTAD domain-containing putative transcriptional regulator [Deinococcus sp. DB0503]|uniref:BTAD domain-containing putative transcriptional regulator n=1 Tax=Deinococcus sp. DB0503 TaxID=2479203 RepID=UPI0018E033D0|nr:BTAD domain-containing putative transcriptional regulator [Deinococcus sp. DB0503]MBI0447168.1 hypothetical protein [Deinococcus sp. DB0503]